MKALHLSLAGMIAVVMAAQVGAVEKPDNAKLLVGKWEVTTAKAAKGTALPPGTVFEFTKDGKLQITVKTGGKEDTVLDLEYKVMDDKIEIIIKAVKKTDTLTIKKISDKALILESTNNDLVEYKRIP